MRSRPIPTPAVLTTLARAASAPTSSRSANMKRRAGAGVAAREDRLLRRRQDRGRMAAALEGGLCQFNVESVEEARDLVAVATLARRGRADGLPGQSRRRRRAPMPRSRPAPPTTNSALPSSAALDAYRRSARRCPASRCTGITVHIGSQLTSLDPLEAAFVQIGAVDRASPRSRATISPGRSRRRPRRAATSAVSPSRRPRKNMARWRAG